MYKVSWFSRLESLEVLIEQFRDDSFSAEMSREIIVHGDFPIPDITYLTNLKSQSKILLKFLFGIDRVKYFGY